METGDALTIVEQIQNADIYSIFFVSLVIIPILLAAWITILKNFDLTTKVLKTITFILLGLYIFSIAVLKFGTTKDVKIEIASKKIKSYLKANNWELIGLERIKDNIDSNYDSKFINELVSKFPLDFSIVKLTDKSDPVGLKYIGGVQVEEKKYETARKKIINYLNEFEKGKKLGGFNRIREYVDSRYDNYFLEELITRYPDSLKRIILTDPNDKIGIKLTGN